MKHATFRSPRDIYPNLQYPCHSQELEEMRQEVQKKQLELQAVKTVVRRWNPLKLERLQFLPWNKTTPDFTGNDFCVVFLVCSTCRMEEKMEKKDPCAQVEGSQKTIS